ncbi:U1 zinc finger-domain-containing protein [Jimgerdemannia flammicorona]|uniref:U1 zinc finger-domain-containing protein n=2 Tax=Jimgerdemannia flammicorona TaxID=994334 RepID=A0A433BA73_9FUNG|nr:U1 zinc finger-domain-containing protein [Jimgerdemannia flammicorona]RUS15644.1 U1 zinc finger-domain-containing protein [Jimgerdemannia flammicorona]
MARQPPSSEKESAFVMPKYYCEYCDIYLTHDSAAVRKAHNAGKNHLLNVRTYYAELGQDNAQVIIDEVTEAHQSIEETGFPHQYGLGGGMPVTGPPPPGFPDPATSPTTYQPFPYPIPSAGFPHFRSIDSGQEYPPTGHPQYMSIDFGQGHPPIYGATSVFQAPPAANGCIPTVLKYLPQEQFPVNEPHPQPAPPGVAPFSESPMAGTGSVNHLSSDMKAMRL